MHKAKAAVITKTGKVFCSTTHGIAYSQIPDQEKDDVDSGFVIDNIFVSDNKRFKMKEIVLIRHGQSKHNVNLTDDLDSEITDEGQNQCRRTANFLKQHLDNNWQAFTSPFLRCLQTSDILSKVLPVKFKVDPILREVPYLMPHNGLCLQNRREVFPHFDWSVSDFLMSPLSTEEYLDSLRKSIDQWPEKVIIVSHGTPVMTLAKMCQGENLTEIPAWHVNCENNSIRNASVTHVRNQKLVCWNKIF